MDIRRSYSRSQKRKRARNSARAKVVEGNPEAIDWVVIYFGSSSHLPASLFAVADSPVRETAGAFSRQLCDVSSPICTSHRPIACRQILPSILLCSRLLVRNADPPPLSTSVFSAHSLFFFFVCDINAEIPFPSRSPRVLTASSPLLRAVNAVLSRGFRKGVSLSLARARAVFIARNYVVARILRQLSRSRLREIIIIFFFPQTDRCRLSAVSVRAVMYSAAFCFLVSCRFPLWSSP